MKVMTIFFGLSLGVLIGGCCTAPEPRVSPQEAKTPNVRMETRVHRYYYAYAGYEKIANADMSVEERSRAWRDIFRGQGVTWPEGSSVVCDESSRTFTVVNTPENQDRFERELKAIFPVPCVIEFSLCYLKASHQDLSAAGFDAPDRGIDAAPILAKLRQNKKVEIVSCQRACADSGENCVMKNVTEYIYPQDYDVNDITVYAVPSNMAQRASSCRIPTVEPQNFTMREAGLILDATAQALDDGLIELDCKVQFVSDPIWKDYGMRLPFAAGGRTDASPSDVVYYDLEMEQPFFPASSADTRLHIKPGTTLALEAGSNTDAKDGRMAVFFLTVRKLDIVEQK